MTTDTTDRNEETRTQRISLRSRLVSWPLTLIGLTALALMAASTVSAWSRGGDSDIDELKEHAAHRVDRMLDDLE